MTEAPIVFLDHALTRAEERFPDLSASELEEEVRCALRAGRLSGVRPNWLAPARTNDSLYAWTEGRERTFGISGGVTSWHVKTIIAPKEAVRV